MYFGDYISCIRRFNQRAISLLRGSTKQQAVQQLVTVVNSTGRVGLKYGDSADLHHEHHAALGWIQVSGEVRAIRAIRIHLN